MGIGFLRLVRLEWRFDIALAICATAVLCLSVPAAAAQTFLTKAELLEIIPGSTISSKSFAGKPWAQIYSVADGKANGTIRGIYGKRRIYAKWFVRDGKWCENWGVGEACWHIEKVDFRSLRLYDWDGRPRRHLWVLKRKDLTG